MSAARPTRASFTSSVTQGIAFGLILGKPIGIGLFSYIFIKARLSSLPAAVSWQHIIGAGMLGGIGFTMSLFIGSLSFEDPSIVDSMKVGILAASFVSAALGLTFLSLYSRKRKED